MHKTLTPKYHIRAQITGIVRWSCPYDAYVNEHTLRPTAFKVKCRSCGNLVWLGIAAHIPAGSKTTIAKDSTIPTWAGEDCSFDPLPKALFDPNKPIKQRGRIGAIVLHDGVYLSDEELPYSPNETEPYQ